MKFLTAIACLFFSIHSSAQNLPAQGLLIDLNADLGVRTADDNKVEAWQNQASIPALKEFVRQDSGRKVKGSGRPALRKKLKEIRGHNTIVFLKQELINFDEDAADSLIQGAGFTWLAIVKPYQQAGELKEVNTIFGNLKNGGNYEGMWANFADDNRVWCSGRNGITFGRWDTNNPFIATTQKLDSTRYYLIAGRLGAGTDTVLTEIFINDMKVQAATGPFPVNPAANPSKMAVGAERDATNHPGVEAFRGELARLIVYKRPLSNAELESLGKELIKEYGLIFALP